MEELLNKLIAKGWKPFGDNAIKFDYYWMKTNGWYWAITYLYRDSYIDDDWDEVEYEQWRHQFNLRQLVSKESGLWQFCIENWLIPEDKMGHERLLDLTFWPYWPEVKAQMHSRTYEYRIIESALCNEEDLEKFLLENIEIS